MRVFIESCGTKYAMEIGEEYRDKHYNVII